jgi:peroxiredoxin
MELKQTPELTNKGLLGRCKQFAMYVENNVVKTVLVSEGQGDPTGYINPDATSAKAMIQAIQSVKNFELY